MDMHPPARVTLVQFQSKAAETILPRMRRFFEEAKEYGSDIIVFPEYILGNRISVDHERVQGFFGLAKEFGMYAIAGLVEAHDAQWATAALVVDREGELLGRQFKAHPAAGPPPHYWPPVGESIAEAQGILGSDWPVFHLDFARIGILQCYDGFFPEAWGCTSYSGAEVIFWINGRQGQVEDHFAISAAHGYGCVVGANISDGMNTGFAAPPHQNIIQAFAAPEPARLFPRINLPGDDCVHAELDMRQLRRVRKHLRTMHQRRPELYGMLTRDVRMWQDYPDIPWDFPEAPDLVNRAQL
jgi:predicted amidohydrolase